MATTTNYSWSTPDDTALVKDGASAIRTLGSSVDTTVKALNPGTTSGDIDYYTSSTAKARLAKGTALQYLRMNSGATAPEWATLSAGYSTVQTFTSTGSWTVPAGVTRCAVYVVGGGGGGGSGNARVDAANVVGGSGGSGGAFGFDPFYTVTPGASITVTVGAGGTGGAAVTATSTSTSANNGTAGNDSSFGTLLVGKGTLGSGNAGTTFATNFTAAASLTTSTLVAVRAAGAGGYNSGFSNTYNGQNGTISILTQAGSLGANGTNASVGTFVTNGGTSIEAGFAGGGGGGGGHQNGVGNAIASAGLNGGGSGGGGAKSTTDITTTGAAGGAGAANTGGGGGGGGGGGKVGTGAAVATGGAGGNGGSGFVAIFY